MAIVKNIEGLDMEPYRTFFLPFDSTNLNILISTIQFKIERHQVIRKKCKGEICGTNLWQNHII